MALACDRPGPPPAAQTPPACADVPDAEAGRCWARNSTGTTKTRLAAARALDNYRDGDRAKIMGALHPGLGPALARWWADARAGPTSGAGTAGRSAGPACARAHRRAAGERPGALVSLLGPFDADPAWLGGLGRVTCMRRGPVGGCRPRDRRSPRLCGRPRRSRAARRRVRPARGGQRRAPGRDHGPCT